MRRQKGIELNEVTIAVAIIAILAAVAAPAYIAHIRSAEEQRLVEEEMTQGVYQIETLVCDDHRCVLTVKHEGALDIEAANRVRLLNPED